MGPAATSARGGASGGVAVGARRQYGMADVAGFEGIDQARVMVRHISAVVKGGIILASLYLKDGEGFGA
eukprot:10556929-Lingulodinium_polyedra.AAC.1